MDELNMYTEAYIKGPQDTEFYARTYLSTSPPHALIIAIHGFNEHIGRYEHVHSQLANAALNVFAFDQRGFGLTAKKNGGYAKTSWKSQFQDLNWAIDTARGFEGCANLPLFLYGHSMVSPLPTFPSYPYQYPSP